MISVIIPVYREQRSIDSALDRIEGLADRHLLREVLVVQGPQEEYSLPTLIAPHRGRAAQMNYGAEHAQGDIFLFLHADTILPVNALSLIARAGTGAFSLHFASSRPALRAIALLTTLRSRLLRLPYGDQAMFLHRECFFQAGGFPEIPILEDVLLAEKIRPRVLPEYVVTSGRRYEQAGLWRTVLRHRRIMLGHALGLSPARLATWR